MLLDLVAGHTSVEHPWFQQELHADGPSPDGDRYIWSDRVRDASGDPGCTGVPWVASPGPRPGYYLKNFYDEQPALNFGYARAAGRTSRGASPSTPRARGATVQALREIMAFWLDRGVAGFRVDMAFSLVKDDPGYVETDRAVARAARTGSTATYPEAVLLPEGARAAVPAPDPRFHADFFLVIDQAHRALFDNGGAGTLPWRPRARPASSTPTGAGLARRSSCTRGRDTRTARPDRPVLLAIGRPRLLPAALRRPRRPSSSARRSPSCSPGAPCRRIYYGDEIGMRYLPDLPDLEGSVCYPGLQPGRLPHARCSGTTPPNAGFSTAAPDRLYLPGRPGPGPPDRRRAAGRPRLDPAPGAST